MSCGNIIAIIAIIVGIILFVTNRFLDYRKRRKEIINAFANSIIELKTVIEIHSIPNRASADTFFTNLFVKQDAAMSVIRDKLDAETATEFDEKWAEYKEERERYNRYWDTDLKGKFHIHSHFSKLIKLTEELVKIANKI